MARPAPLARATQDAALQLLKADHEEVKVLFDEFEDTDEPRERDVVARRLRGLLTVHARIEEELFYPALRETLDDDDQALLEEASVEHETARELIAKLETGDVDVERYAALLKVLGEYVRHHVDEEEDELFPRARAAKLDQASLAAAMLERKQALMTELGLEDDEEEDVDEDDEDDEDFEDDEDEDEDEDEDDDEEWDDEEEDADADVDEDEDEEEEEDKADDDKDDDASTDDEDEETAPAPARRRSSR